MSNKTTAQNNTVANTAEVIAQDHVPTETVDHVEPVTAEGKTIQQVLDETESNLKAVKASVANRRDWISIVGAGVIAGVGNAANMIVANKLQADLEPDAETQRYSAMEIVAVTAVTAGVATALRAAVDFIPQVNSNEANSLIATSVIGNTSFVAAALLRDQAIGLFKGSITDLMSADELEEAQAQA